MQEPKRKGRPRMTDEQKAEAKARRKQAKEEAIANGTYTPPPPRKVPIDKNGGMGVDKKELASKLVAMARTGMKLPRVDTFSADAIRERFELYLDECQTNGVIPTMEGVYNWMGLSRNAWWLIITRAESHIRSDDVIHTMEAIKTVMGEIVSSAADAGLINTAIGVLKLTNNFGYKDVKQVEHNTDINVQIGMSDAKALTSKYTPEQFFVDAECSEIDAESEPQTETT